MTLEENYQDLIDRLERSGEPICLEAASSLKVLLKERQYSVSENLKWASMMAKSICYNEAYAGEKVDGIA